MAKTEFSVHKDQLEVKLTRIFEASREQIWQAITDPSTIPQWWGPRKFETIVDKMDMRVGGEWRFLNKDEQGNEYAFHGVYKEIVSPERVVQTFNFEGIPGDHEIIETMTLEDLGGTTRMTTVSKYQNIEDLDGMVNSGMEGGAVETWERLAELVENK